jgi:hypothetical protein
VAAGFDLRITPRGCMTASADEPPAVTLARFAGTTEELFDLAHARLVQRRRFDVRLPYGPMDWTVVVLHAFWDSWIHERDVSTRPRMDCSWRPQPPSCFSAIKWSRD